MEVELLLPFLKLKSDRPFVISTWAQSIDGMLSQIRGKPTAISCPESLRLTHAIRSLSDGILVGVSTIIFDNPSLSCRYEHATKQPRPIILDSTLKIPTDAQVCTRKPIIFTTQNYNQLKFTELIQKGCEIVILEHDQECVPIHHVLSYLKIHYQMNTLMVEGGPRILDSFKDYSDLFIITIAPKLFGGGVPLTNPLSQMKTIEFDDVLWQTFGKDSVMIASRT
jgi:riboflavin-specific deaminase-like protein